MKNKTLLLLAATMAASSASLAQTLSPIRPQYQFPTAPIAGAGAAAVPLGDSGLFFAPYVAGTYGYDDNLFQSNQNEKSSSLYIVSPGFKLDARGPSSVFQMSYEANLGRYNQSEDDDYVDQTFRTSVDFLATREAAVRLGYDYIRGHDPRGSTDRGISTEPDKYRLSMPSAVFSYGQTGAPGRIEIYGSDAHRQYLNNRSVTTLSDRKTEEYGGAFYWRVMPKTQLLVEARHTDQKYRDPTSTQSSEEERYYVGATWEATALTSGTVKVGQLKKKFDAGFPTFTGTSWEAIVTWQPRTYSKLDIFTYRQPTESTGLGTFILTDAVGAIWTHNWSTWVTTELNARFIRDKYQQFPRTDDTTLLGAKVAYKFRRWLTFGAEYQYTNRDSNQGSFDYDRNIFLITAVATM